MPLSRSALLSSLSRDCRDMWDYLNRLEDEHFGGGLSFDEPLPHLPDYHQRLRQRQAQSGLFETKIDPDLFHVKIDVGHFRPEEISVKIVDNYIVVNCKHEERSEGHGVVSREFTRRYLLPNELERETVTSYITQQRVLIIQAPKKQLEPPPANERVVSMKE